MPPQLGALRETFERLMDLQRRVSSATEQKNDAWRHDVVAARQEIADTIGSMARLLAAWDPPLNAADEYRDFQKYFSATRRALALHQALWPAVSIDTAAADFAESVREVRTAYKNLGNALDALVRAAADKAIFGRE